MREIVVAGVPACEVFRTQPTRLLLQLNNAVAQHRVFTGEQFLRQPITTFVDIVLRAGEMIVDPQPRGSAKIIGQRKDFVARFALAKQPLRVGTSRADGEQLGRDTDKTREQQLFTVEFRPEPRHGVKQPAREPLARRCRVTDMFS